MPQVVRLSEAVERLETLDVDYTIYASEPWMEDSCAIVSPEPEEGGLPPQAAEAGLAYFLEVGIACDFIDDWIASLDDKPSASAICQRLIQYAIHDA